MRARNTPRERWTQARMNEPELTGLPAPTRTFENLPGLTERLPATFRIPVARRRETEPGVTTKELDS
jgi:hypothetical protein